MEEDTSVFWKFVHVVAAQLNDRPCSQKQREGKESNPIHHCKHLSLGSFKVASGNLKGNIKRKQNRCKYCRLRMKLAGEKGLSPHTCFGCSFHEGAVCRKYNCWQRHLAEVHVIWLRRTSNKTMMSLSSMLFLPSLCFRM
jgi:hypothetical protein